MTLKKSIPENPDVIDYTIQGEKLQIKINNLVFSPPANNPITADNMVINKGETVIDIGT